MAGSDPVTGAVQQGQQTLTKQADQAINSAINSEVGKIIAIPDSIKKVGQEALTLATDIDNIVSAGGALITAAAEGNMGFLTVPALAALTVAQIAALKNLGSQMDAHGQALGGAAKSYATTEDTIKKAADAQSTGNQQVMQSGNNLLTSVNQDASVSSQQIGTLAANTQEA